MNAVPPVDVDSLPPTQYLILDVLAARWRTGEHLWTFPYRLWQAVEALEKLGMVGWKSGIVAKTIMVWLTDTGRELVVTADYESPHERDRAKDLAAAREVGWQEALSACSPPGVAERAALNTAVTGLQRRIAERLGDFAEALALFAKDQEQVAARLAGLDAAPKQETMTS
jgi:hypothetical protein